MQENEFEKNLQQKMDALQVPPSEELWQKIKTEVADKKRRRRGVVFFFLLAGLAISGFVITNLEGWRGKKEIVEAKGLAPQIATNESKQAANNTSVDNKPLPETKQINKGIEVADVAFAKENKRHNMPDAKPILQSKEKLHQSYPVKTKTKAVVKTYVVAPVAEEMEDGQNEVETMPGINTAVSPEIKSDKTSPGKIDSLHADKVAQAVIAKVETQKEEIKKPDTEKKKEQSTSKKWHLGLTFSGGVSSTGNSYLSNPLYARNLNADPTTGVPPVSGVSYSPSETGSGFAFAAGIALSRGISKNTSLSTGLQYMQMTTSIKTGMPSVLNNGVYFESYTYGSVKNYKNRYHFISLPVGFSAKVFSIWKRDVCVNAGASFSKLLSANAVNFNESQGVYYKDASLFNRIQVGLNTSIAFNLASKNKAAFYIGPEFYYGLRPMASSGIYADAHPVFIGLRLQKNLWQ